MINTTLCYIQRGEEYLMLHRVKKENDLNKDKWIGIGGKFLDRESPEDCLLREAEEALKTVLAATRNLEVVTALGMPLRVHNELYNCAVIIQKGKILGVVPKTHLPNYGEFYELRNFSRPPEKTWK